MEKIMVPKYRAFDGTLFDEEDRCVRYESTMVDIRNVQMVLESRPDNMDFANGHGYIQHDPLNFNIAKNMVLDLVLRYTPTEHQDEVRKRVKYYGLSSPKHDPTTINNFSRSVEFMGTNSHLVDFIRSRFSTTDKKLREWGQLYYAFNPEKGEQICLNEKSPTM